MNSQSWEEHMFKKAAQGSITASLTDQWDKGQCFQWHPLQRVQLLKGNWATSWRNPRMMSNEMIVIAQDLQAEDTRTKRGKRMALLRRSQNLPTETTRSASSEASSKLQISISYSSRRYTKQSLKTLPADATRGMIYFKYNFLSFV